jgi:hypothetical protein
MAYMKDTDRKCQQCDKRATVEVYDATNSLYGDYCRPHGIQLVKRLDERRE